MLLGLFGASMQTLIFPLQWELLLFQKAVCIRSDHHCCIYQKEQGRYSSTTKHLKGDIFLKYSPRWDFLTVSFPHSNEYLFSPWWEWQPLSEHTRQRFAGRIYQYSPVKLGLVLSPCFQKMTPICSARNKDHGKRSLCWMHGNTYHTHSNIQFSTWHASWYIVQQTDHTGMQREYNLI